jgi:ankyrin repeat protein
VNKVIKCLKDPSLTSDENRVSLQEVMANALGSQQRARVSFMPQITSTTNWLINFPENNSDENDSIVVAWKVPLKYSKKVAVLGENKKQFTLGSDQVRDSVTFITGQSNNLRQRVATRIVQELVVSAPEYLFCQTTIENLKIPRETSLTREIVAKCVSGVSSVDMHLIEGKITQKKIVLVLTDIERSSEAMEVNEKRAIVEKLSNLFIPLILPIDQSKLEILCGNLKESVTKHEIEIMPLSKSTVSQSLKRNLNWTASQSEDFLKNIQYHQHHQDVLSDPSSIQAYCKLLADMHEIPSNTFSLFELYIQNQIFSFCDSDKTHSEIYLRSALIHSALNHYDSSVPLINSNEELSKIELIFVCDSTGVLEFSSNYVRDFLVAVSFLTIDKSWSTNLTLKQVFSETKFRLVRLFFDGYLGLESNSSLYVSQKLLLNKIIPFVDEDLLKVVCTEGLFFIFQSAFKVKMALEKNLFSTEKLNACLWTTCSSNGNIALSLKSLGADLMSLIDKRLALGLLHRIAFTGNCELMTLILETLRKIKEMDLRSARDYELSQDDKIDKESDVSSQAVQYLLTVVNTKYEMECTPLHVAAERGHLEMVRLLISHGASGDAVDNFRNRWTPLHYSVFNGHFEVTTELLKSICVTRHTYYEEDFQVRYEINTNWAFSKLASTGISLGLNLLLEKGIDVVARPYDSFARKHESADAFSDYQDLLFFVIENRDKIVRNCLMGRGVSFAAVETHRTDILKILLKFGDDANAKDVNEFTLLHVAAEVGSEATFGCLFDLAPADMMNNKGVTPLEIAASKGHNGIIATLLELREAVPTFPALCHAALRTDRICFDILLNAGVPSTGPNGETVLHYAAAHASLQTWEFLIEQNFDPSKVDQSGRTPLHLAASRKDGTTDCLRWLLTHDLNPNAQSNQGETPLHLACKSGSVKSTEILLKHNADPDINDENGYNALHHSAGSVDCLNLLLEKGNIVIEARTKDDLTISQLLEAVGNLEGLMALYKFIKSTSSKHQLLKIEIMAAHKRLTGAMREKGKNIGKKNPPIKTLHDAVYYLKKKKVIEFIKKGVNVNSTKWGHRQTPLHLAVLTKNFTYVKLLVDAKADVNACDGSNDTPLHNAAKIGNQKIGAYLLDHGAELEAVNMQGRRPLHAALTKRCSGFAELLLKKSADPNSVTSCGATALHLAAENVFEPKILKCLVAKGADPRALNSIHRMPLHCAAYKGKLKNVKYLLSIDKIGLVAKDHLGETALHLAAEEGHLDVVEYLVANGADISSTNHHNKVPLEVTKDVKCKQFLIRKTQESSSGMLKGDSSRFHNINVI